MAYLYEAGWRQGSILEADLPLDAVVLDQISQQPARSEGRHGRWAIANQNCDLALTECDDGEPSVELRPIFTDDPRQLGDPVFELPPHRYRVHTLQQPASSRVTSSSDLSANGTSRRDPAAAREIALTTWLGLRNDRPAVPTAWVPLAERIGEAVRKRSNRPFGQRVRDVLMQFDAYKQPVQFSLFAVIERPEDDEAAREWLSEIARSIPVTLGVASRIEAATAAGISFELIETSYAADVTQLTWRPGNPEAEGAT